MRFVLELLNYSVRVASMAIVVLTAVISLRVGKPSTSVKLYAVVTPAIISYLIATSPFTFSMPIFLAYLINIFSMNAPVLLWWHCQRKVEYCIRVYFEEKPRTDFIAFFRSLAV